MSSRNRLLVYVLFFVTGATALIYQVTWTRDLTLIFGASYQAVSIVLAAFMGGLALGGFVFGAVSDRSARPLRLYAFLELGVGIFALLLPLGFGAINAGYISIAKSIDGITPFLNLIRASFTFGAILIPTMCMGGSLPVLTRFLVRRNEEFGERVSMLYGINTLGAVAGTVLSGFLLLPWLGVFQTQIVAILINVFVGLIALFLDLKWRESSIVQLSQPQADSPVKTQPIEKRRSLQFAFWATAMCGMCALAFEVLWTRGLSIVMGTTTYSLTVMLAAFLSGIAIGGILNSFLFGNRFSVATRLGFILLLIGITSLSVTQLIPRLPEISLKINQSLYGHLEGVRPFTTLLVSYLIMLIPAILFGMAFPTAAEAREHLQRTVGKSVGDCVGLNTFGAILGALVAGFVLIPLLGLQDSMLWTSVFLMGYGIFLLCHELQFKIEHPRLAWIACFAGWITLISLPGQMSLWDYHLIGTFRNNAVEAFVQPDGTIDVKGGLGYSSLIYYREGKNSTVSVTQSSKQRSLLINGKSVATDSFRDIGLEKLMGHIPCLLHPNPQTGLVVGLGAGVTLGAAAIHPTMKQVQVVEIEPAVLDAARKFDYINNQALNNPKVSIEIQDGRNYLLTTNQTFDVITADPIHPWAAGSTYLYTTEYYSTAKARLNPDGIMCQWLPLYELSRENVKSIVRTFLAVFKHCMLWQTNLDMIVIGSDEPIQLDIEQLSLRIQHPTLHEDFLKTDINNVMEFLALFVTDTVGMKQFSQNAVINTDDNLYLEFSSPHSVGGKTTGTNLYEISQFRSTPMYLVEPMKEQSLTDLEKEWSKYQQVESKLLMTELTAISAGRREQAECYPELIAEVELLLGELPGYRRAKHLLSLHELSCGMSYLYRENPEIAVVYLQNAIEHYPDNALAYNELAKLLANQDQFEEAFEHVDRALASRPIFADGWITRGSLYEMQGDFQQAEECYVEALKIRPMYSNAHYKLGVLAVKMSRPNQAIFQFIQALEENPDFPDALFGLASTIFQQGEIENAKKYFDKVLQINPDHAKAHCGVGMYWQVKGELDKAIQSYRSAIEIEPEFPLVHYNLASALYTIGRYEEAKVHLEKAREQGYEVPEEFVQKLNETLSNN